MNDANYTKMKELRLLGMAEEYERQEDIEDIETYTFEQRLTLLIDSECERQHSNRTNRYIRNANFPNTQARVDLIRYDKDRKLNRQLINELATNRYIQKKRNIIITGATGSGKTYLASAFGINACNAGYRTIYIRLPDLLQKLKFAQKFGDYEKTIRVYQKCNLLILDEWALIPISAEDLALLLELFEVRRRFGSTILCSQYSVEGWLRRMGEGPISEAIIDRIEPGSTKIFIDGQESMRKKMED